MVVNPNPTIRNFKLGIFFILKNNKNKIYMFMLYCRPLRYILRLCYPTTLFMLVLFVIVLCFL